MLEIGSIKVLGEIFKQAFDIKKGLQKNAEENFDKKLTSVFSDLNTSSKAYISLISDLRVELMNSKNIECFEITLEKALAQRSNMVMDRNRVLASIDYIKSILLLKNPGLEPDPCIQLAKPGNVEKNLMNFCGSARHFFYQIEREPEIFGEPEEESSTRCTGIFHRIRRMLNMIEPSMEPDINQLKEFAAREIETMMRIQERAWETTCRLWEPIKAQKEKALKALKI